MSESEGKGGREPMSARRLLGIWAIVGIVALVVFGALLASSALSGIGQSGEDFEPELADQPQSEFDEPEPEPVDDEEETDYLNSDERVVTRRFTDASRPISAIAQFPDDRVLVGHNGGRIALLEGARGFATFFEQGTGVTDLAVLEDGRFASSGVDGMVRVWNSDDPEEPLVTYTGHFGAQALSVFALPDGRVASGDNQRRIHIWNPDDAVPEAAITFEASAEVFDILPDGRLASTNPRSSLVLIWDLEQPNEPPQRFRHHLGPVRALAALPDGRIATGGTDGIVRVFNPDDPNALPQVLHGHAGEVTQLFVLQDGRLASTSSDRTVKVWDLMEEFANDTATFDQHLAKVQAIGQLSDRRIVSGARTGDLKIWSTEQLIEPDGENFRAGFLARPLDDGRLMTTENDGNLYLWDPEAVEEPPTFLPLISNSFSEISELTDGRIAFTNLRPERVIIVDPADPSGEPVLLPAPGGQITALPDGRFASSNYDQPIEIWDPDDRERGPIVLGDSVGNGLLTTLPNGQIAASSTNTTETTNSTITIWDVAQPDQPIARFESDGNIGAPVPIGQHLIGATFLTDDRFEAKVWDLRDPNAEPKLLTIENDYAQSIEPLFNRLIAGVGFEEDQIFIWNLDEAGSEPVLTLEIDGYASTVTVLPDERIAVGTIGGSIQIFELLEGFEPENFRLHPSVVTGIFPISDGRIVSVGFGDQPRATQPGFWENVVPPSFTDR